MNKWITWQIDGQNPIPGADNSVNQYPRISLMDVPLLDARTLPCGPWRVLEEDLRVQAIRQLDFSKVIFENCLLNDEESITGDEKLERLKKRANIRLDARVMKALMDEEGHKTLEWIYSLGFKHLDFYGTVLLAEDGRKYIPALYRTSEWHMICRWLGPDMDKEDFALSFVIPMKVL